MAATCRTSDGDLLDVICQNHYGHLNGTVEAVLDANPDLARQAQPYRAGLVFHLPELPAPTETLVQLWD
ncbi:tail protein X [Pseudomonas sp. JQ170]|uniref:tail protein X n=1 Tax=unclassified Pseudomonas TaxID=196821 RepID=UPI00265429C4|nr:MULTISPECIES: tail protein X [unclassified Pseudomonas]MDN7142682.1 tail protein X [Pseudomonas sp. JQ170]WRO77966.1 tail protein X [Pseudomonas sp. 170C]